MLGKKKKKKKLQVHSRWTLKKNVCIARSIGRMPVTQLAKDDGQTTERAMYSQAATYYKGAGSFWIHVPSTYSTDSSQCVQREYSV